jgi:hypothetical protein
LDAPVCVMMSLMAARVLSLLRPMQNTCALFEFVRIII